ncbi:MAG: aminoacyl-tRNA hydrolase [Phycisphaerales bacterium]|nr:aminoacyl-tRNA hydrolase [Phycisphaerales bacterium]
MKLIVGLGNPGRQYKGTRHNAGFMAVDRLARRHVAPGATPRSRFHAGLMEARIHDEKCLLMQPTTYMNRSGQAVGEAVRFYRLAVEDDLMIVVDDVALPCGVIRLRPIGSGGGHNGLADIEHHLGTIEYPRCRVGIDPPGQVVQHDYVLGRFTPEQKVLVDEAIERACDAIECWVIQGIDETMNQFNRKPEQSKTTERSEGPSNE